VTAQFRTHGLTFRSRPPPVPLPLFRQYLIYDFASRHINVKLHANRVSRGHERVGQLVDSENGPALARPSKESRYLPKDAPFARHCKYILVGLLTINRQSHDGTRIELDDLVDGRLKINALSRRSN